MAEQTRFRLPWKVVEHTESYVVTDADDQPLYYVYFADEKQRHFHQPVRLSKDQARRLALGAARLPDLIALERHAKSGALFNPPDDPTAE